MKPPVCMNLPELTQMHGQVTCPGKRIYQKTTDFSQNGRFQEFCDAAVSTVRQWRF